MAATSTLSPTSSPHIASLSVSFSAGKVAELHTRRVYTPPSAEPALAYRNVHIIDPQWDDDEPGLQIISYADQINAIFEESIRRYNCKQKRKDRKKSLDYYAELTRPESQIQPVYSYVLQLGNRDTCGTFDDTFDLAYYKSLAANERSEYALAHVNNSQLHDDVIEILTRAGEQFEDRFPNLRVLAAVIHDDEMTPHLTLDICPVSTGYARGVDTRCGMTRALAEMGFEMGDPNAEHHASIVNWQNAVKSWVAEEIMPQFGLSRQVMGNKEPHRDVPEFKAWMRKREREKEREEANQTVDYTPEFTRKNTTETTATTVVDMTENEALGVDLSANIATQEAYLATLIAEREREEDERDARRARFAQEAQAERDELARLREEVAQVREQLSDGHRILDAITAPLLSFSEWMIDRCKPEVRDTWGDRFGRWIDAYTDHVGHMVERFVPGFTYEKGDQDETRRGLSR